MGFLMSTILLYTSFFAVNLLLYAIFLWLGARCVKAAKPTFLRAVTATVVISLTGIAAFVLLAWLQSELLGGDDVLGLLLWLVTLLGEVFLFWLIIKVTVRTTLLRASLVWLVGMIAIAISLATVLLVIRPFVFEAFVVGNNSMAPTLVGWHKTQACPYCGHVLIVPTQGPDDPANPFQQDQQAICSFCFRTSRADGQPPDVGPDRFMVNKLLKPRRWDLVVFRSLQDPSIKNVKRLAGLPGEKVFIKEGAVWINGTKLALPEEIAHLQYLAGDEMPVHASGSPDEPWELKENECVVLGDFALQSADSRHWGALPLSNVEGVVTVRYWPLSRWHIWR
jgi:signal peptidase I